jgi:hypothetical protein
VLPFQFETGLVVIETGHSLYDVERFFRMTLPAVLTKLVLMYISVATGEIIEWNSGKYLEVLPVPGFHPVTFYALGLGMFPYQLVPRIRMIEMYCRLKGFRTMTAGTVCPESLLVIISMTTETGSSKTQVGILLGLRLGIINKLGFVTVLAELFTMGTFQGISR